MISTTRGSVLQLTIRRDVAQTTVNRVSYSAYYVNLYILTLDDQFGRINLNIDSYIRIIYFLYRYETSDTDLLQTLVLL